MATKKKETKSTEPKPDEEVIEGQDTAVTEVQSDTAPEESDPTELATSGEPTPEAVELVASDDPTNDGPSESDSGVPGQPVDEASASTITKDSPGEELPVDLTGYTVSMSIREATTEPGLHDLLSKAARHATSTHAGQESVFALHQLEMLAGRLKVLIPAGIAATEDPDLRAALNSLLGLL
jgi:hypothetical protein